MDTLPNERRRETFSSLGGVILAMAGTAIGLGNIWRFPYMMGAFGGVWFLLAYLLFVVILGIPALICEWTLGRLTRRGPLGAYEEASVPGGLWWGRLFSFGIFMAASYYAVVIGWVARYAVVFLTGSGPILRPRPEFESFTGSLGTQGIFVVACLLVCAGSLSFGLRRGIARVSSVITPLVLLLFLGLAVHMLNLQDAWPMTLAYLREGSHFRPATVLAALGQCFFSLALGGTIMVTYGSYLKASHSIPRGVAATAGLDTAGSLLASLIIVPPALVFGVDLASGPALLFEVVPPLFQSMPAGELLAGLFLAAVWLCAMLSLIGAWEVIIAGLQDTWHWTRSRSVAFLLVSQALLTIPAMLSVDYIFFSDLLWGSTLQPLGAAAAVMALTWSIKRRRAIEEMERSSSLQAPRWLFWWMKFALPASVIVCLLYGWFG